VCRGELELIATPNQTRFRRQFLHPAGFTLGDSSAGWFGINGGIAYLRNARAADGAATLWYELERRIWE